MGTRKKGAYVWEGAAHDAGSGAGNSSDSQHWAAPGQHAAAAAAAGLPHVIKQQTEECHSWLADQMPWELQALILQHLGSGDLLALFRTCHATRALVLGHAKRVRLKTAGCPAGSAHVLGGLLQLQPASTSVASVASSNQMSSQLWISTTKDTSLTQLLPPDTVLQEGGCKHLFLDGANVASEADAQALVAACRGLSQLSLSSVMIRQPTFFPALAQGCQGITHLTLDQLAFSSLEAAQSLGALASGLPALQLLVVEQLMYADRLLVRCGPGQATPLMPRVTSLDTMLWYSIYDNYRDLVWLHGCEGESHDESYPRDHQEGIDARMVRAMEAQPHLFSALTELTIFWDDVPGGSILTWGPFPWSALRGLTALQSLTTTRISVREGDVVTAMPALQSVRLNPASATFENDPWQVDILKLAPVLRGIKRLSIPCINPHYKPPQGDSLQCLQQLGQLLGSAEQLDCSAWGEGWVELEVDEQLLSEAQLRALAPLKQHIKKLRLFRWPCYEPLTPGMHEGWAELLANLEALAEDHNQGMPWALYPLLDKCPKLAVVHVPLKYCNTQDISHKADFWVRALANHGASRQFELSVSVSRCWGDEEKWQKWLCDVEEQDKRVGALTGGRMRVVHGERMIWRSSMWAI